ncbi:MAG TPA: ZIP family metal transporter [Pirellulales bacterium]|jgi:zinc and cadmium transporter
MNPAALAAVYSLAIFAAALLGGWVPLVVRLTHTRLQLALSFVAGVILGIGLLHLVPHGFEELQNIDQAVGWTMVGFLAMFFLERFFHFHRHDAPAEETHKHSHSHGHDTDHSHHHDEPCDHDHADLHKAGALSWSGVLIGLALHGLMDGIAIAAAVQVEAGEPHGGLAGFGTFLAVLLHKPFDSLTIGTLLAASGWPRRWRHIVNVLYAVVAPLGILGFTLGLAELQKAHPALVGCTLCFAGGVFLCIATSDLLPEVQFHSHDRIKLSIALLLGVALASAIVLVETSGHSKPTAAISRHGSNSEFRL